MNFSGRDLIKLRRPLLGMLGLIVGAVGLAAWRAGEGQKALLERDAAASARNQIEQRLRQVRTEEQELKERAQLFQQLQNAGIVGEEKRLDWTELLRQIQHDLRLPGMRYEFGPQKALDNVSGVAYAYFASPMRLQLRLLHEGDLLAFLERLQREAKALLLVRSCTLTPGESAGETRAALAQLSAECELQWITLRRATNSQ